MTQLVSLSPRRNPVASRWNAGGTTQAVTTSTWTAVNAPTEYTTWAGPGSVPSVGVASGSQSVFMRPGVYHIAAFVHFASNSSGRRIGALDLKTTLDGAASSSTDRIEHSFASTGTATWSGPVREFYEYTDPTTYARGLAWQSSGANLNIPNAPGASVMVERYDCWNYVP